MLISRTTVKIKANKKNTQNRIESDYQKNCIRDLFLAIQEKPRSKFELLLQFVSTRKQGEDRRKKEKGTYRKDFVFVFTGNLGDENLCLILSLSIKSPSPLICQINRTIKQSPKRDQALFRQHKKTEFFFSEERERG